MQTRIGVRVLGILGMVAILGVVAPGPGRQTSEAAGQAAFNPPATAGCNVALGIQGATVSTHYVQAENAYDYTGAGNTGEYLSFLCNIGVAKGPGSAGAAITVNYCVAANSNQDKREVRDTNGFNGPHTVSYKRFLRIGNTNVTIIVLTDMGPSGDYFTGMNFDTYATNLVNRNKPTCATGLGGGGNWAGTVTIAANPLVQEPGKNITMTATASPTLVGTGLKLQILGGAVGGTPGLQKDCGTVNSCTYVATSSVELNATVTAVVVDGTTLKAQSATLNIKWAMAADWDGNMHFYVGALGRGDQGVDNIKVKPGVAVPLILDLDIPVDDTPSQMFIYDGSDLVVACVTGFHCATTVTSATAKTTIYHAVVSRPDNTHVAASASVTVVWAGDGAATVCTEGWQYTVNAIDGPLEGARIKDADGGDLGPVTVGMKLCAHQYIKTTGTTTVHVRMPGLQGLTSGGRLGTWEFSVRPNSTVNIQPHLKNIDGVQGYGVEVEILNGVTGAKSLESSQSDITLNGGVGRAGLRGTAAEVAYDAATKVMTITVLESKVIATHNNPSFAPVTMYPGQRLSMTPTTMSPAVSFTSAFTNTRRMPHLAIAP